MSGLAFFDTNILVYTDDRSSPQKQTQALNLFTDRQRLGLAVISLQVLQEYFAAVTRKLGVDAEIAQQEIQVLSRGRVIHFTTSDVIAAIELHRLTRLPSGMR